MPQGTAPKRTAAQTRAKGGAAKKRTASKAGAKAKAAGAVGDTRAGRDGPHRRALRDSAILARVHAGATTKEVAEEFDVTQRTVQRIVTGFSEMPSVLEADARQIIVDVGRWYRRLVADYESMAWAHSATNPNVALGAKKAAAEAMRSYIELLGAIGQLPSDLSLVRAESVLRRIVDEMVDTMARAESGELSMEDAVSFWRALAAPADRPQLRAV
ncbi:MAG: hypothetical protein JWN32_494 [Solirubrobacterales bacterium]|nr:hypothetical protein [Solirubrobacterales bacterium]